MNRIHPQAALVTAALIAMSGCSAPPSERPGVTPPAAASATPPTASPTVTPPVMSTPSPRTALPTGATPVRLDPADFTTVIDNPYWPMAPGTRWTYREVDTDGEINAVVVVVTRQTRRIANGVVARVVRDTVRHRGEIIEDTLDWYAQDRAGNVWYLGEHTAEFEAGRLTTRSGSFEAGVAGAQAGVIMPARPTPGQFYRQEHLRGEAEDDGEVLSIREQVRAPSGRYRNALLTRDTTRLDRNIAELKFYARGVGPVLVLDVGGGGGREELIRVDRVGPEAGLGPLGRPAG